MKYIAAAVVGALVGALLCSVLFAWNATRQELVLARVERQLGGCQQYREAIDASFQLQARKKGELRREISGLREELASCEQALP